MSFAPSRPTRYLSDLIPICSRLPAATVDQFIGAPRGMAHPGGRMNHGKLAAALRFDDEQMVSVLEFLSCLSLVEVTGNEVALSDTGKRIASAGIAARRRLFAEVAIRLPVIRELVDTLAGEPSRSLSRAKLLDALGAQSCALDADRVFDHVISWGRYARLLVYDAQTGQVSLT